MKSRMLPSMLVSAAIATGATAQTPPAPPRQPPPENVRDAAPQLADAPKFTITNGRIHATLLQPDAKKGFYRGTRFDWGGLIASLTLGGQEYYGLWFEKTASNVRDYVFEGDTLIAGPNTALVGPAESFDPSNPPGWAEAAPGQGFLKIGVGILRKPDDGAPYSSFRLYDFIDQGSWKVTHGPDWATYTHTLRDAATGYGYVYTKTIRLIAGTSEMTIEHKLENVGTKPIATSMFNHNFLTFGRDPTAQMPTVSTPYPIEFVAPPRGDAAKLTDGHIHYTRALAGDEVFSANIKGYQTVADAQFTIANAAGASVNTVSDRIWSRLPLWSIRRIVAVEPYVALTVAPGESTAWTFRYRFTTPR